MICWLRVSSLFEEPEQMIVGLGADTSCIFIANDVDAAPCRESAPALAPALELARVIPPTYNWLCAHGRCAVPASLPIRLS